MFRWAIKFVALRVVLIALTGQLKAKNWPALLLLFSFILSFSFSFFCLAVELLVEAIKLRSNFGLFNETFGQLAQSVGRVNISGSNYSQLINDSANRS